MGWSEAGVGRACATRAVTHSSPPHTHAPQLALRKLQDRLEAVQREMQYQREREESHRDLVRGRVRGGVRFYSLGVCSGATASGC